MQTFTTGAASRPKLSLPFGAGASRGKVATELRPATLSGQELRRIVAAMVD